MKRRIISLIIDEDCEPPGLEEKREFSSCSRVAYKFEHEGIQYGSYTVIDKQFLPQETVEKAAALMLLYALEAYSELGY